MCLHMRKSLRFTESRLLLWKCTNLVRNETISDSGILNWQTICSDALGVLSAGDQSLDNELYNNQTHVYLDEFSRI